MACVGILARVHKMISFVANSWLFLLLWSAVRHQDYGDGTAIGRQSDLLLATGWESILVLTISLTRLALCRCAEA